MNLNSDNPDTCSKSFCQESTRIRTQIQPSKLKVNQIQEMPIVAMTGQATIVYVKTRSENSAQDIIHIFEKRFLTLESSVFKVERILLSVSHLKQQPIYQ